MSKLARNRFRNVALKLESLEKRENPAPIVPVYNSNPGAFAQLYLDFDGNTGPNGWCGTSGVITTAVFGTDGDPNNFSATELNLIDQIWKRIAEDFAPFNINVTTVVPSDFNDKHAVRLAIGGQTGGINWGGVGGVGCVGSFYSGGSANNVAFVHSPNLSNNAKNVAMATSHEAGHTFGLQHQDNPPCGGYHGGGNYSGENKGPLMGAPYSATREIWWKGFEGCGTQDDMLILANSNNAFGYRADDISDVAGTARRLRNNNGVLAGNLTGIITKTTDVDWFAFTSPAGTANITVSAVALGPNLDTIMELYQDVGGTPVLLASVDTAGNIFGGTINFNVPSGKKYIVVKSDGDYGEVGAYTLSGTLPATGEIPGFDGRPEDNHPFASLFDGVDTSAFDAVPFPNVRLLDLDPQSARADDIALATAARRRSSAVTPATTTLAAAITSVKPVGIGSDTDNGSQETSTASVIRVLARSAAPVDLNPDLVTL